MKYKDPDIKLVHADYLERYRNILSAIELSDCDDKVCSVAHTVHDIAERLVNPETKPRVYFIGNGGSAAIASHQCTDFIKNFEVPAYAFNDGSLLTCFSNDYGYGEAFERLIKIFADRNDLVFAISSSGQSTNILRGAQAAKTVGAFLITLSGFKPDNPLRKLGDYNFYVPSNSYRYVENAHLHLLDYLVDYGINLLNGYKKS